MVLRSGLRVRRIPFFTLIAYTLLTIWALISLAPLAWMAATSLKEVSVAIKIPPSFIPVFSSGKGSDEARTTWEEYTFVPTTINYERLFKLAPVGRWFFNSAVVSVLHTLGMLLFSSMAGYAFAKKEFRGKNLIFAVLLSTMMIPGIVLLTPLFLLISQMGLMDTYSGLILPGLVGAFGIFLMKQFIVTIPSELIEAAKVDGASEPSIFVHVILPLSKPALATLGIFSFMASWNDFLWPLLVTQSKSMRTLAVGLSTLQQELMTDYGLLMAGCVVAALPMAVIFFALQKYFMKGLTIGAVKG